MYRCGILKLDRIFPIVFIFFCLLSGMTNYIYFPFLAVITICLAFIVDTSKNRLAYLALFLPWYPSLGSVYGSIIMWVFAILSLINMVYTKKRKTSISAFLFATIILIGFIFTRSSIADVFKYAAPIFIALISSFNCAEEYDLEISISMFSISCIICAVVALFGSEFPNLMTNTEQIKYYGTADYFQNLLNGKIIRFGSLDTDANFASYNFTMAAIMLYFVKRFKNNQRNIIELIVYAILLIFGALSLSVTFYICAIIFTACLVIYSESKRKVPIIVFIVIIGIAIMYAQSKTNAVISAYYNRLDNATMESRVTIWEAYLNQVFSSIQGVLIGFGSMSQLEYSAHSTWVRLIYMHGVPGICIILWYVINNICRNNRKIIKIFPVLFLFALYNSTLDAFRTNSIYFIPFYLVVMRGLNSLAGIERIGQSDEQYKQQGN